MKKINLKNNRGITIIPIIVMIIVIVFLTSIVVTRIDIGTDIRNYNYMRADIELLESKIMAYYNENGDIPVGEKIDDVQSLIGEEINSRDNNEYYIIDISKLYNITLNFGGGDLSNKDIYIVNEQSHKVYYLKGVVYENEIYYTDSL